MSLPLVQIGQGEYAICYVPRGNRIALEGPGMTHRDVERLRAGIITVATDALLYQRLGRDSSVTHRASVPFAETAKPENRRDCHSVGLWTWTAAWVVAAIVLTILAILGVTR